MRSTEAIGCGIGFARSAVNDWQTRFITSQEGTLPHVTASRRNTNIKRIGWPSAAGAT